MRFFLVTLIILLSFTGVSCRQQDSNLKDITSDLRLKNNTQSNQYIQQKLIIRKKNAPAQESHTITYSGAFNITDPDKFYGIAIKNISFFDRLTINNKPVHSCFSRETQYMFMPRYFKLDNGLLRKGQNTISIIIKIPGEEHGGITHRVLLLNREKFLSDSSLDRIIFHMIPFAVMVLLLTLSITSVLIFFILRKDQIFIILSLIGFVPGIIILLIIVPVISAQQSFYISLLHAAVPLSAVLYMKYIQVIYNVKMSEHNKFFMPILFYTVFIILFSKEFIINSFVDRAIAVAAIISGIMYLLYMVRRLDKIKHNTGRLIYSIFFISTAGCFFAWENIASLTGSSLRGFIYIYSSPFIYFTAAAFLAFRFSLKHKQDDALYTALHSNDETPDTTDDRENSQLIINDDCIKKLNTVKQFIKENYHHDISREGLAAAIGMNPNYMSRLFKQHNGIKISDYINLLRIKEAEERLSNGNERIIDIALSVGFESLTTFNRAFKKVAETTPSKFRDNNRE